MNIFDKNILIVGDSPSSKNESQDVPFVGTKSYETLMAWIGKMHIPIKNLTIVNACDLSKSFLKDCTIGIAAKNGMVFYTRYDKVITLGVKAHTLFKNQPNFNVYKLDHPSGSNLKLNDKEYVDKMLKDCKKWLRS